MHLLSLFFFWRSQQSGALMPQSLSCFTLSIIMNHHKSMGSSFSGSVLFNVAEWLGGRETALALHGKSHAALSIALFNGSIAIPTPSCIRSLFPYCYCTISYLCGCPVDVNAYSLCWQSELNSTQGGESGGGGERRGRKSVNDMQPGVAEGPIKPCMEAGWIQQ